MIKRGHYFWLIVAAALVFFAPNIRPNAVLLPLDLLYHSGPFSESIPESLRIVHNPHLSDLITIYSPWMELFRAGEAGLPLWNPYSFCGSPLLANAQNGFLFPLSWIYLLLPVDLASQAVAVGKLVFCGIFAFLFYRRLGFEPQACLLGAAAYMFSGHLLAWLGYPTSFPLIAMPFLFWALEKYLSTQRIRELAWLSAAYGVLYLGGQPQTAFVISIGSLFYFIIRARAQKISIIRIYLSLAVAGLLGFCLAAPQVLPFLEYFAESAAYRLRGTFGWKTYPWFTTLSWMVPRFFGDLREGNFWGFSSFLGEAVYIGCIPLVFAMLGMIVSRKDSFYWAIVAVFSFGFLGLYVPLAKNLYLRIPLLSSIDNNKLMALITFGLVSFAVIGFHYLLQNHSRRQGIITLWIFLCGIWAVYVALGMLYFKEPIGQLRLRGFELREAAFHGAFLLAAAVILWLWKNENLPRLHAAALLLALTLADVFRVWMYYYPSYPREHHRPRSTSLEFLEKNSGISRFLGLGGMLPPETSILYRLQDARGYDGLTDYRYYQLLGRIDPGVHDLIARLRSSAPAGREWALRTLFYRSLEPYLNARDPDLIFALRRLDYWSSDLSRIERADLLSLLGIRYILSPKGNPLPASAGFRLVHSSDAEVWENPKSLPRAFISTRAIFAADDAEALDRISDPAFPLLKTAVITAGKGLIAQTEAEGRAGAELLPVEILRYSAHSVEMKAASRGGGWLVLCDLFYPGWRASIDGRPAPISPANYLFRGIELPAGAHIVKFAYRPVSFYAGVGLSVLAISVLVAIAARKSG